MKREPISPQSIDGRNLSKVSQGARESKEELRHVKNNPVLHTR